MRIVLLAVAAGLIILGLWMISAGFVETPQPTAPTGQSVAAPGQTGSPIMLGVVLLAGGVVSLIAILRRR